MSKLPTRIERFRVVRDAIMKKTHRMVPSASFPREGVWEMRVGSFSIVYCEPGVNGFHNGRERGHNLQIWPDAAINEHGFMEHGPKVANVDWDVPDDFTILSFKGGTWDVSLLALLTPETNVAAFRRTGTR